MSHSDQAPLKTPFASIAICTYNRSRWLKGTLRFVVQQDYPADRWELLVIDNNSSDDTAGVVAQFADAPKAPRYILEKEQGLSRARNRALREAKGDIIVFLDDDTEGPRHWLTELMRPYAEDTEGKIGVVGGEIIPGFPDGLPSWLKGQWEPLAYRETPGPLPRRQLPMGANFSARLELARKAGGFRTDLGRTGNTLAGSEDHDFIRRVAQSGAEVWFVPEACITHLIPGNRLTFRYAVKHAFDSSRSRVIEKLASPGGARGWLATRLLVYPPQAVLYTLLAGLCYLLFLRGRAMRLFARSARAAGYVVEALRQLFHGRRKASSTS